MHKNSRFNILQANGNCNPHFVVIDGQRTSSGHAEFGAKTVSLEMPRDKAIALADKMQADSFVNTKNKGNSAFFAVTDVSTRDEILVPVSGNAAWNR